MKSSLRKLMPTSIWQTAGFCKRLPMYWRLDRSDFLRVKQGITGLPLFITPEVSVFIPESVTAYTNWRAAGIECPTSSIETHDFLKLAEGRKALVDVGAQSGFMSAVFARSRLGVAQILSIEPDPQVRPILERARELNSRSDIDWSISTDAVGEFDGPFQMPVSNYLHESRQSRASMPQFVEVRSRTLASILNELTWKPDIIKIDVESYEYEIINSSLEVLAQIKPALQLEVHGEILNRRNLDARDFMAPLFELGYRGIRSKYRGFDQWIQLIKREIVSRISLEAA